MATKKTAPKQEEVTIEILIDNDQETVYAVEKNFFPIVHRKGTGYAVLLGISRISEYYPTLDEAVKDSKRNDIDRIITIIQIIQELTTKKQ